MAASVFTKTRLNPRRLLVLPISRPSQAPTFPISAFSTSDAALPPPPPAAAVAACPSQSRAPSLSSNPEKQRGTFSKLLLFLPGAITFGLGTWQLFRRQEKVEMLEYCRKRLEMEPISWNDPPSLGRDLGSLEFRRVACEGDFDESKSIYIGPRSRSISGVTENGYYVITPLVPRESDPGGVQQPVLVNRGWVPRAWRDKNIQNQENPNKALEAREADSTTNEKHAWWQFWSRRPTVSKVKDPTLPPLKVIGVIRGSEKPSIFVPANDPDRGQWFYVDVPMIARACGLPENTLYIEDINEDVNAANPYPIPKDVKTLIRHSVMPQDHLNYSITWYSLSAAVTFMAFKRIKAKKTR